MLSSNRSPIYAVEFKNTQNNAELISRFHRALRGEYNAIQAYGQLADMSPNDHLRQIILSIQDDESGHLQEFSRIYAQLTGAKQVSVEQSPLPSSFENGIEESIQDELKDSKFYQDTSLYTTDRRIQKSLLYASHDEARHATWFSYIWNKVFRQMA